MTDTLLIASTAQQRCRHASMLREEGSAAHLGLNHSLRKKKRKKTEKTRTLMPSAASGSDYTDIQLQLDTYVDI